MAVHASRCPVRSQQRERSLRVIESGQVLPRLGRVARLAPCNSLVRPHLHHAFFELPLVGIRMATGTSQISPVIGHRRFRLKLRRLLVAVGARHGNVASGQDEVRLLVTHQGKRGRLVPFKVVAEVTSVEVGRGNKLPRMTVAVTVRAARKLDLE